MIHAEKCEVCGLEYADFRTGYTFASVRAELWIDDDDASRWRQKRRHGVLGYWHEIKISMWEIHRAECAAPEIDETPTDSAGEY